MDQTDVLPVTSPDISEDVTTQTQEVVLPEVATTQPTTQPKGSQTPSENLYAALAEERRLRKEAEDKLIQATSIPSEPDEVFSDEGKALHQEITSLRTELSGIKEDLTKEKLYVMYPALKDKQAEFDEFRADPENSGMSLRTAAKAFLVENGLLEAPKPERKGLEPATGGRRETPASGLSSEDVKKLRETNYKKYLEMLKAGKLKDIK